MSWCWWRCGLRWIRRERLTYSELIDKAESCEAQLRALGDRPDMAALKTGKGRPSVKVVKERLEDLASGKEYETLRDYVKTEKQQKDAAKRAKALLDAEAQSLMQQALRCAKCD